MIKKIGTLAGILAFSVAFASEGGGHSSGGGEGYLLLWKTINTLILLAGLFIVYKKWIGPALEKRRKSVADMVLEAKKTMEDSEKALKEAELKLEEAKSKFEETIRLAKETAEQERQTALKEAEEIASRIKAQAEETIQVEIKKAQAELRRYAVHKAIEISEKIIKEKMNPELERELIRKTLKSLS
jgi:F-type H+-transporting ATPase subunit b